MFIFISMGLVGYFIPINEMQKYFEGFGILTPVVYFLVILASYTFAPISGGSFSFVGFYLFKENVVIINYIASIFSFIINFTIARKFGRPWVEKLAGKDSMTKVDKFTNEYGVITLILVRVFLLSLHDFVSYSYGLTKIKFKTYFIISVFASIPPLTLWYFISRRTENPFYFMGALYLITIVFWMFYLFLSRYIKKIDDLTVGGSLTII